MSAFWLELTLSNICVSAALALVAYAVHRHGRHPLLAHALWLGVLLKLVTPPVLTVPLIPFEGPALSAELARVEEQLASLSTPGSTSAEIRTLSLVGADEAATTMSGEAHHLRGAAGWTWLLGSALALAISLFRVVQFHVAMRRAAAPAPAELQGLSDRVSRSLGLHRSPPVFTTTARITPYVWWFGGPPRVVVPSPLVKSLSPAQLQLVLAHELAHIRRRDHWVRWVEWLSGVAFWWNPVTWWARHHLRAAEELACDAVVLSTVQPDQRRYASSLLAVAEFLSTEGVRPPLVASTLTSGEELEARIHMILSDRLPRTPRWLLSASLALGVFCLPMSIAYAQDFEAVQRRLTSAVEAGELTQAQARTMMEALRRASTDKPARADVDKRALRERYATMEQRVEAGIKAGKITREQGDARLAEARKSMFGDAAKAKVEPDMRAKRERYAEYEKGLMARVQKGAMTKAEADAKLKEARESMFGGAAKGKVEPDMRAKRERYAEYERGLMARVKTGAITKEEADAKLLDARGKMFGSDARKADGAAATDARAMRERYAEYEKGLMARVQKGAMTKKEADAKLKEAREKMFGGAERAKGKSQADEKATAARYEALETRIKAAVESGRLTEEEGKARLRQAKERMAEGAKKGPASEGAKGDQPGGDKPKRDQDALRARYAEYEKRLKAAVDKGEMTADEAATKLKEARQRMSGDRR
ncbi:MAG: M56 family metallopeptidase [Planctomycetota bacterium]|nr:M56 family metallopeptidase [Planctomycetota bacterium]